MTPFALDRTLQLATRHPGSPQVSGPMAVVPIVGPDRPGYAGPRSGLRLGNVRTYGTLEVHNPSADGLSIVPLHIGWIQKGAQNHALCRSTLLGPGETTVIEDACCVQAGQGGYLEEADQWFFVLPIGIREAALELRGTKSFGKLWGAISTFNQRFGEKSRGHLEDLIGKGRSKLTRYRSRFELVPGQTGALFFLRDRLVGLELAPNAAYFAEVWPALICFAYGTEAHGLETVHGWTPPTPPVLAGEDLDALAGALNHLRAERTARLLGAADALRPASFSVTAEDRYGDHELFHAIGESFAGQVVRRDDGDLVYASLFARAAHLREVLAA